MEELHTDSIDGGHEASYGPRSRARGGRTPTVISPEGKLGYVFLVPVGKRLPAVSVGNKMLLQTVPIAVLAGRDRILWINVFILPAGFNPKTIPAL
jgi:hypothetical protein